MRSFEIIGNGIALDVSDNSNLTVEFISTVFNEDRLFAGSYSYPILFPFTDKNKTFFEQSHFLENRLARKEREVTINLFGMSWKKATVTYKIVSEGYEASLMVDNGSIADALRERSIASVFTETNNGKFVAHLPIRLGANVWEIYAKIKEYNRSVGTSPMVFPTFRSPMITGELLEDNHAFVNYFMNADWIAIGYKYSPFFYHTWVIREVCKWLGFEAKGSYLEDPFIKTLIIYNTGFRMGQDILFDEKIYPAQHLPDISVADYFKVIRNDHRVFIYFDSLTRTAYFEKSADVLASKESLDVTGSIVAGSFGINGQTTTGYKLTSRIDEADELYETYSYVKAVSVGLSETPKDIPMGAGIPFMWKGTYQNVANIRMPYTMQQGNFYGPLEQFEAVKNKENTYGRNPFALRFLSWKGQKDIAGMTMGSSTSDDIGVQENITYNQSLSPSGDKGIVSQYCLSHYDFICTSEKVEFKAELDVCQFSNLNPLGKIVIADQTRAKVEALMDKTTFEPRTDGNKIQAKITCYPYYNIAAVSNRIKITVDESDITKPEKKIYAKLFITGRHFKKNTSSYKWEVVDLWIEFYYDRDGQLNADKEKNIPYSISVIKTGEAPTTISGISPDHNPKPGSEVDLWVWRKVTGKISIEYRVTYTLDTPADGSYEVLPQSGP
ncbi:hypothetical protein [Sphingobacterium spiritivorum]|uniref:hypothetical protein n=1 Tax=Sphingobacterium spiritivorum TaxID=258 RepID=UPI003DA22F47